MDSMVLTPKGFVPMADVRVGMNVTDPVTGGQTEVIGVYPQGEVDIWRVVFDDGASLEVGDEHLWLMRRANFHRPGSKLSPERAFAAENLSAGVVTRSRWDGYRIGTTATLRRWVEAGDGVRMPLTEPVVFTRNAREMTVLDPYLVGLLLGDGCLSSLCVTTVEPEVRDYLLALGATAHAGGRAPSFGIVGAVAKRLRVFLHMHGLKGARSWEKFIPEASLHRSLADRMALLQGLMDADGTVDERGRVYFASASRRLAEGVQWLARSLGGKARLRERNGARYPHLGEVRTGRPSYVVRIWHPRSDNIFRLARKRARCRPMGWNGGYEITREVVSVEYVGRKAAQCIRVASLHGLYIADDFVVTHNTFGMLGDFAHHALMYGRHANGVFFRRTAKQLEEVIPETFRIFPSLGAEWRKGDATWEWVSGPAAGARLKFRHLWDEADAENYQGHAYTVIYFEEAVNWPTSKPLDRLRATLRSAHGVPARFRATGNPGGPGHSWVKARYIDPAPLGYRRIVDPVTGHERVFIPARLEDNPALTRSDPEYERRLLASGTADLVKAWRFGIWDIVAGGFFDDVWRPERHILRPFEIPRTWRARRSFDWGSAKPSSLGIWAIADGGPVPALPGRRFPRGSAVRIGEWYTAERDANGAVRPNVGLRLDNPTLGAEIARITRDLACGGCVADPSIFVEQGGPSIYDQMREGARRHGASLTFAPADNSRVPGWAKMRDMLTESAKETPEGPGLWVFANCTDFIRTVPVLQADSRKPDDVDSDAEDHCADEARYLVTSLVTRERQLVGIRGL